MTDSERREAFALRLEGATWESIGAALGYRGTTVREDLTNCVLRRTRYADCPYPRLRQLVREEFGGSVRCFSESCGIHGSTAYALLNGRLELSPAQALKIETATGTAAAELMRRKERVHL